MRSSRERLLVVLLTVLCIYAVTLKDSISEAITTLLFENNIMADASDINSSTLRIRPSPTVTLPVVRPSPTVTLPVVRPSPTVTLPVVRPSPTVTLPVVRPSPTVTLPVVTPKPTPIITPIHMHTILKGPYKGWYADDEAHYLRCKTCDVELIYRNPHYAADGVIEGRTKHTFNSNTGKCTVCGYQISIVTPKPTVYKINVSSNNIEYGTVNAPSSAKAGDKVTIKAVLKDIKLYKFVRWESSDVDIVNEFQTTASFIMPAQDVNISAIFEKKAIETTPTITPVPTPTNPIITPKPTPSFPVITLEPTPTPPIIIPTPVPIITPTPTLMAITPNPIGTVEGQEESLDVEQTSDSQIYLQDKAGYEVSILKNIPFGTQDMYKAELDLGSDEYYKPGKNYELVAAETEYAKFDGWYMNGNRLDNQQYFSYTGSGVVRLIAKWSCIHKDTTFKYDDDKHWMECNKCEVYLSYSPHVMNTDDICTECDYKLIRHKLSTYKLEIIFENDETGLSPGDVIECNSGEKIILIAEKYNHNAIFGEWYIDGVEYNTSSDGTIISFIMPDHKVTIYKKYK